MRLLFVIPKAPVWDKTHTIPLGMAYLTAVLEKKNCYGIKVVDLNFESEKTFNDLIRESDYANFTVFSANVQEIFRLCRKAKKLNPRIRTVLGGPHPTALPKETMQEKSVDIIVFGEGEVTIAEMYDRLRKNKSLKGILGTGYKEGKKVIMNKPRPLIKDLDTIPLPAYHFFPPIEKYTGFNPSTDNPKKSLPIITSRGCPYNCCFCFKALFGYQYRARSVESVMREWEWMVKDLDVDQIGVVDDNFNFSIDRAKKICREIIKRKLIVPWLTPNGIRADSVDRELLNLMKRSGCYRVAFGIETGSPEILKTLGKSLSLDQVRRAVKLAKEAGLETTGFFIIGLPGENEKTMRMTIDFAKELDSDYAQFTILNPMPGTRVFDMINKDGKFLRDWNELGGHFDGCSFILGDVNPELAVRMRNQAYREFYLRPQKLLRMFLNKRTRYSGARELLHFLTFK